MTLQNFAAFNINPLADPVDELARLHAVHHELLTRYDRVLSESHSDPLTGALNRRGADQAYGEIISTEESPENGIIFADIDFFKGINTRFGHPVGDKVIKHFAAMLQRHTRADDFLVDANDSTSRHGITVRHGGEEFLLILPNTSLEATIKKAEALRRIIESTPYILKDGTQIFLTTSMGVAGHRSSTGECFEDAVLRTNTAMLRAKNNGRNRVQTYDDMTTTTLTQRAFSKAKRLFAERRATTHYVQPTPQRPEGLIQLTLTLLKSNGRLTT